jgi:hypothetical protein
MAAAPPPKADELQPFPPKEQLPGVAFCITSPPPWRTCFFPLLSSSLSCHLHSTLSGECSFFFCLFVCPLACVVSPFKSVSSTLLLLLTGSSSVSRCTARFVFSLVPSFGFRFTFRTWWIGIGSTRSFVHAKRSCQLGSSPFFFLCLCRRLLQAHVLLQFCVLCLSSYFFSYYDLVVGSCFPEKKKE